MGGLREFFTREYLARLEALSLSITGKADIGFTGARKSASKGNSLEFADFRDYTPGDDLRRVDWKGFGRLDKLYLKLFTEEKQAAVNIFLDNSQSMDFGQPNKFDFARRMAATIAYLAMKNADRACIYCYNETITARKTNMSSKVMFAQLTDFLDNLEPGGQTGIYRAVLETGGVNIGQGSSFIISDLFSPNDDCKEAVRFLQNKKQHVTLIHVLDISEYDPLALGASGALRLWDSENSEALEVYLDSAAIKAYEAAFKGFQNDIKAFCERRGASYIFAPTNTNILKLLAIGSPA